jgi:FkbM family methyltransferase
LGKPNKEMFTSTAAPALQSGVRRNLRVFLLQNIARGVFHLVPRRLSRSIAMSILSSLAPRDRYMIASYLASNSNIVRFVVHGAQGSFESLSSDTAILAKYALTGSWAPRSIKLLRDTLENTLGTYIDIGANIGLTLVPVAKLGVNCYAFEPEPRNFESLLRNVARNAEGASLRLFQVALADFTGEATLRLAEGNLGDHRLVKLDRALEPAEQSAPSAHEVIVPARSLDSFNLEIIDPLVVKIDAQGAEPMIVRGGQETLARAKLLIIEFAPFHIHQLSESVEEMISFLDRSFAKLSYALGEDEPFYFAKPKCDVIHFLHEYFEENMFGYKYLDVAAANP